MPYVILHRENSEWVQFGRQQETAKKALAELMRLRNEGSKEEYRVKVKR